MKILIVDDSELIRERLRDSFKTISNLEIVGEAQNGIVALQMIKENTPDFVILDIRMPEMDGITVLKILKELGIKCEVCILTTFSYPLFKRKLIERGANYFFDKNQDIQELIKLVTKIADKFIEKFDEQSSKFS